MFRPILWLLVIPLLVLGRPVAWCADVQEKTTDHWITSVRELRELSVEEAKAGQPVRLTGVVTYLDRFRGAAFLQDDTGGTYFSTRQSYAQRNRDEPLDYRLGDRVEITGVSSSGSFAPVPRAASQGGQVAIRVVSWSQSLPEPIVLTPGRLMDPAKDGWWIETTGVVRRLVTFGKRVTLQLSNGFEEFTVVIPWDSKKEGLPNEYVGASVRVRGVFGAISDLQRQLVGVQLYTPDWSQITRLDRGVEDTLADPAVPLGQLMQFRANPTDRLHVAGTVTAAFPGKGFYLRGEDASVAVTSDDQQLPRPGQMVDVVAYPHFSKGRVALHTPVVRVRSEGPPPEPHNVAPSALANPRWHGELVRTQARLLDLFVNGSDCLLLLADDARTFSVRLELSNGQSAPGYKLESWLDITGIALTDTETVDQPLEPWAKVRPITVGSYSLQLRGTEDIRLLRAPPFWTLRRVVVILGSGASLFILVLLWNVLLRHRLRKRTEELALKIEHEQVLAERARIARELHDTVEQELAGIGLQLDLVRARAEAIPERAKSALEMAMRMLRRTQRETRASIQDLRSGLFDRADFATALRTFVENLRDEKQVPIELELAGSSRRMPAVTEHNLLRLAQEAINNAVRHAQAKRIDVRLTTVHTGELCLEVIDDGVGFDPEMQWAGHFGLQGMEERARKIGATLHIESQEGRGTRIQIRLPLHPHSPGKSL